MACRWGQLLALEKATELLGIGGTYSGFSGRKTSAVGFAFGT